MKYGKISEDDVYRLLVRTGLDFINPLGGAINLKNISNLLFTSRYQVKKYMDILKSKELVELKCFNFSSEDECYPPYWGYCLTEKGRKTEYFLEQQKKEIELIEKCFDFV